MACVACGGPPLPDPSQRAAEDHDAYLHMVQECCILLIFSIGANAIIVSSLCSARGTPPAAAAAATSSLATTTVKPQPSPPCQPDDAGKRLSGEEDEEEEEQRLARHKKRARRERRKSNLSQETKMPPADSEPSSQGCGSEFRNGTEPATNRSALMMGCGSEFRNGTDPPLQSSLWSMLVLPETFDGTSLTAELRASKASSLQGKAHLMPALMPAAQQELRASKASSLQGLSLSPSWSGALSVAPGSDKGNEGGAQSDAHKLCALSSADMARGLFAVSRT